MTDLSILMWQEMTAPERLAFEADGRIPARLVPNPVVGSLQWAPSGNMLEGIPENMSRFLANNGKTLGYGWGPGSSIMFGTEHGDITLLAGQWVYKHADGTHTVHDAPHDGITVEQARAILWAHGMPGFAPLDDIMSPIDFEHYTKDAVEALAWARESGGLT